MQSHISETKTCQCVLNDDNMSIAHSYKHQMISAHSWWPYQERQRDTSKYIFLIINKWKMLLQLINSVVRGNWSGWESLLGGSDFPPIQNKRLSWEPSDWQSVSTDPSWKHTERINYHQHTTDLSSEPLE